MGDIQDEPKMIGAGLTPTTVANSILRRAFGTGEYVTPMKLQKLLFFCHLSVSEVYGSAFAH